jgi:hypothetical protein
LTWQELSSCLPPALQSFLAAKYGIVGKLRDPGPESPTGYNVDQ